MHHSPIYVQLAHIFPFHFDLYKLLRIKILCLSHFLYGILIIVIHLLHEGSLLRELWDFDLERTLIEARLLVRVRRNKRCHVHFDDRLLERERFIDDYCAWVEGDDFDRHFLGHLKEHWLKRDDKREAEP